MRLNLVWANGHKRWKAWAMALSCYFVWLTRGKWVWGRLELHVVSAKVGWMHRHHGESITRRSRPMSSEHFSSRRWLSMREKVFSRKVHSIVAQIGLAELLWLAKQLALSELLRIEELQKKHQQRWRQKSRQNKAIKSQDCVWNLS